MRKNVLFYDLLSQFLKERPDLMWQSGSSAGVIEAVRLPWYRVLHWKEEPDGMAESRLDLAVANDSPVGRFYQLYNLFVEKKLVSVKRKTANPAEFDLYILANYGSWYVGFKTKLAET